jgi:uncharacterized protein YfaP (DUF2135 family)
LVGLEPRVVLGTGDIQATLTWDSTNDLDLWVTDPSGDTIYYRNSLSSTGGELDVDANADCLNLTTDPIENIFWDTGEAPMGRFEVAVQYFKQCETNAPISYHLRLEVDGEVTEYDNVILAEGQKQDVVTFER